jgi:hypothetical protein
MTGSSPLVWRQARKREGVSIRARICKDIGRMRTRLADRKDGKKKDRFCQRFRWVEEFDLDLSFTATPKEAWVVTEGTASCCQLLSSLFPWTVGNCPPRRHMRAQIAMGEER